MHEKKFIEYIINLKSKIYPNFIQYKIIILQFISNKHRLNQIFAVFSAFSVNCDWKFFNFTYIKWVDCNNIEGNYLI